MTLNGKVVLITGANGGIGSAASLHFAGEKSLLVLQYHRNSSTKNALEKKLADSHTRYDFIKADLSSRKDIKRIFMFIKEKYKRLDILINVAGIEIQVDDPLDTDKWARIFSVNLFAPVECFREALKLMKKGVMVNISSVAGKTGTSYDPLSMSYALSKSALNKFSEIAATSYTPGIRTVFIEPGYVKTPMWSHTNEKEFRKYSNKVPIKRFVMPEEVADLIVSVVKNDALNGQAFTIDGGLSLKSLL